MMRDGLLKLKNIGPKSADWLISIGIRRPAQLEALGAVAVYRRLRQRYPVSKNMLWALQGALLGLPYNQLPAEMKVALLAELQSSAPTDEDGNS